VKYKNLIYPVLLLLLMACSSIDCPMDTKVEVKYKFMGKVTTMTDTLTVSTLIKDGNDSVLLNRVCNVDSFNLPVSYFRPQDSLIFQFTDTNQVTLYDTLIIDKVNNPHFEAVDCAPSYFHTITSVRCTANRIDHVDIGNPTVDYDDSKAHIHIVLKNTDE